MENPYQAPGDGTRAPTNSGGSGIDAHSTCNGRCLGSRLSIIFVALVFGAVSAFSIIGFLFNLASNYPGTDEPVIAVDPLWMLGHVIRGVGLGVLTWFLFRYQSAIKKYRGPSGEHGEPLVVIHDAMWKTGAIVLGAITVYAIAYVAFTRAAT